MSECNIKQPYLQNPLCSSIFFYRLKQGQIVPFSFLFSTFLLHVQNIVSCSGRMQHLVPLFSKLSGFTNDYFTPCSSKILFQIAFECIIGVLVQTNQFWQLTTNNYFMICNSKIAFPIASEWTNTRHCFKILSVLKYEKKTLSL